MMNSESSEVTVIVSQTSLSDNINRLEIQPQYVYESNVHAQNILSTLNDQRKCGLLCDMTVIVQGIELQAHKAVLSACSSYFSGIITDPANVSHNIVLELSSITRLGMENILEFAYTSKLTLSRDNIDDVLAAAKELDVKNLEHACLNLLRQKLFQDSSDYNVPQCVDRSNACKNSTISRKLVPKSEKLPSATSEQKPDENSALEKSGGVNVLKNTLGSCDDKVQHQHMVKSQRIIGSAEDCTKPSTWVGDCPLMAQLTLNPKSDISHVHEHGGSSVGGTKHIPVPQHGNQHFSVVKQNQQEVLQQFLQHQEYRNASAKLCAMIAPQQEAGKPTCSAYNSDTDEALSAEEDHDRSIQCSSDASLFNCAKLKRELDVVLPFSIDEITKLPRSELQELLNKHPNLNVQQISAVHEIRRRGKNRIAAQRCRKRKMDCIRSLQCELERLHKCHNNLMQERRCVRENMMQLSQMFQKRYDQVFSNIRATACVQDHVEHDSGHCGRADSSSERPADHIISSMADYFKNESNCASELAERLLKLPCDNLPPLALPCQSSTEVVVVCDDDENTTGMCFNSCSPEMSSSTSCLSDDNRLDPYYPSAPSNCHQVTSEPRSCSMRETDNEMESSKSPLDQIAVSNNISNLRTSDQAPAYDQ